MANVEQVVQYVIDELSERGLPPLKTALVKFVYLADIESLREGLPRITDVQWILYKYGPYSFDLDRVIEHVVGRAVDEMVRISLTGRLYRTYHGVGHPGEFKLPPEQRGIINRVLDRWAGEDLPRLLNYVYFETEPMLEAQWQRPLDLSLVRSRPQPVSLTDLLSSRSTPERVQELAHAKKAFWDRSRERRARRIPPSPQARYDEVLLDGLRLTDEIDSTSRERDR